jgi:predicted O-methyltransferase YrrM
MNSAVFSGRARNLLAGLFGNRALKCGIREATEIWAALRQKLDLSCDMAADRRRGYMAKHIRAADLPSPVRYLEIGSFEGGSLAFIHALFAGQVHATVIDPFIDYDELRGTDMSRVEARFRANMQTIGADVRILRGQSVARIPELRATGESFDLIYVDGSHELLDVIADAALSWPLLASGGLMIFDDYRYPGVKPAVDTFVKLISADAIVADIGAQAFVRRRRQRRA